MNTNHMQKRGSNLTATGTSLETFDNIFGDIFVYTKELLLISISSGSVGEVISVILGQFQAVGQLERTSADIFINIMNVTGNLADGTVLQLYQVGQVTLEMAGYYRSTG